MMEKHKYFVAHFHKDNKQNFGFGNCEVGKIGEITNYQDIQEISKAIGEKCKYKEVIILNYKKLY